MSGFYDDEARLARAERRKVMLAALSETEPLLAIELAMDTGYWLNEVDDLLFDLECDGRVRVTRKGYVKK